MLKQRTLSSRISASGVGLHTGKKISLTLNPAPVNSGIIFRRTDLESAPIKASLENVFDTRLSTSLSNEKIKKISKIKILNLWVVRQFKGEYNPIHYHEGDLSGVGYLMLPKGMTNNKLVKNKKIKTNGTIDFINGQRGFLSKSIYNVIPKVKDLLIFPNYLMHTAYPFNIEGEGRSFSFNAKIIFKK